MDKIKHVRTCLHTLQLDGRALDGLGRPEEAGELGLLHWLRDGHGATGFSVADVVDALGAVDTRVGHGALLDHEVAAAARVLADQHALPDLDLVAVAEPLDGGGGESGDLALQPDVLLAGDGELLGLDLLDDPGRLRLAHDIQHRLGLGLASRILDQ